jgi:hypothetical protein
MKYEEKIIIYEERIKKAIKKRDELRKFYLKPLSKRIHALRSCIFTYKKKL